MESQLDVVRTAYRLLVDESRVPVDAQRVSEAALSVPDSDGSPWEVVRAMARAVGDAHTVLVPQEAGMQLQGLVMGAACRFPGFAAHRAHDGFVVGEVLASSPAERADLRPGDVIVEIDGTPMSRGFEDIVSLVAKPDGHRATLRVSRHGSSHELTVCMTAWLPPLVDARRPAPGLGYARLRFVTTSPDPERDAASLLRTAIAELGGHSLRGLILDLRSNPGGYGVTRVASVLTDREVLARYRDAEGTEEIGARTDAPPACSCPMVVLVDDQTLSSAELIALALQDHGVAHVVGQPTAGGLSVPRYVPLAEGHVLMTPERIAVGPRTRRVPDGLRIHPDVVIPNRTPDDVGVGSDPQLACAMEMLGYPA